MVNQHLGTIAQFGDCILKRTMLRVPKILHNFIIHNYVSQNIRQLEKINFIQHLLEVLDADNSFLIELKPNDSLSIFGRMHYSPVHCMMINIVFYFYSTANLVYLSSVNMKVCI